MHLFYMNIKNPDAVWKNELIALLSDFVAQTTPREDLSDYQVDHLVGFLEQERLI